MSDVECIVSFKQHANTNNYDVLNEYGDNIGGLYKSGHGLYYFWPNTSGLGACVSETQLRKIADKLGEENYLTEANAKVS